MSADVLRLRHMCFFAHHGLFPAEGELGQRFEVDLEILGDFSAAGAADDPQKAIDYSRIYPIVEEVVTRRRFKLVEALAEHIAQALGAVLAPIEVRVRVRKPHPPLAAHFDGIEVEIHRTYA